MVHRALPPIYHDVLLQRCLVASSIHNTSSHQGTRTLECRFWMGTGTRRLGSGLVDALRAHEYDVLQGRCERRGGAGHAARGGLGDRDQRLHHVRHQRPVLRLRLDAHRSDGGHLLSYIFLRRFICVSARIDLESRAQQRSRRLSRAETRPGSDP